jgi:formamidopyrimidine-DNA glycosylase
VCGDRIQQVIFADRTFQYCPTCQTGGKKLSDRVLDRLLT